MKWVRPLHDELFLLGHHDYTGVPLVKVRILGAGLAGAMLMELMISRRIELDSRDRIHLLDSRQFPSDPPAAVTTVGEMARQSDPKLVRSWIDYLGEELYRLVGAGLVTEGVLVHAVGGRLRRSSRYVATDALVASQGRVGLRYTAEHPREAPPEDRTAAFAALSVATGLDTVVADGANRTTLPGLRWLAGQLPPAAVTVVEAVTKSVNAFVLTPDR